jgi:hypothetical protein
MQDLAGPHAPIQTGDGFGCGCGCGCGYSALVSRQQRRVFTGIPVSLSINMPTARYFSCRKEADNIIIRMQSRMSVHSILRLKFGLEYVDLMASWNFMTQH